MVIINFILNFVMLKPLSDASDCSMSLSFMIIGLVKLSSEEYF